MRRNSEMEKPKIIHEYDFKKYGLGLSKRNSKMFSEYNDGAGATIFIHRWRCFYCLKLKLKKRIHLRLTQHFYKEHKEVKENNINNVIHLIN